ncbi:hypothetical protein LZ32DRAFT_221927 [Colletotrichum eremochloae]|nr:hypothetical protein LZ32DRAFT_221927 [Colletotrichum eremochloae]
MQHPHPLRRSSRHRLAYSASYSPAPTSAFSRVAMDKWATVDETHSKDEGGHHHKGLTDHPGTQGSIQASPAFGSDPGWSHTKSFTIWLAWRSTSAVRPAWIHRPNRQQRGWSVTSSSHSCHPSHANNLIALAMPYYLSFLRCSYVLVSHNSSCVTPGMRPSILASRAHV